MGSDANVIQGDAMMRNISSSSHLPIFTGILRPFLASALVTDYIIISITFNGKYRNNVFTVILLLEARNGDHRCGPTLRLL